MTGGGTRTIGEALRQAQGRGLARLDAQQLLARLLGCSRAWLIAHDDLPLDPGPGQAYGDWVARRAAGEPFAYIVGEKEFHGLRLRVTPDVLVPRPDTETLVDWAVSLLQGALATVAQPQVLDLGTGSGAIALAVKQAVPAARVAASDRSSAALAVARDNAGRLGLDIAFHEGDWWTGVPSGPWHLALSNPPYIAPGDPHLAELAHEPLAALVAPADGLADLRRVAAGAGSRLAPGGWLLLEHGHDQGAAVRELLRAQGLQHVATRRDLGGNERCTGGRRPQATADRALSPE